MTLQGERLKHDLETSLPSGLAKIMPHQETTTLGLHEHASLRATYSTESGAIPARRNASAPK